MYVDRIVFYAVLAIFQPYNGGFVFVILTHLLCYCGGSAYLYLEFYTVNSVNVITPLVRKRACHWIPKKSRLVRAAIEIFKIDHF